MARKKPPPVKLTAPQKKYVRDLLERLVATARSEEHDRYTAITQGTKTDCQLHHKYWDPKLAEIRKDVKEAFGLNYFTM